MPRHWSFVVVVLGLSAASCASPARFQQTPPVRSVVNPPAAAPRPNAVARPAPPAPAPNVAVPSNAPSAPETPLPIIPELSVIEEVAPDAADTDEADGDAQLQAESEAEADGGLPYDVPIVLNASVESHLDYFSTTARDRFQRWLNRSGRYLPLMTQIFREYGLPEDLVFVSLIESGFNPYAYSRSHAVGAWQFMKGTGLKYGLRIDPYIDERRDVVKSTHAAAAYLKDLYGMFNSWPLALASYNGGEGRVGRAMKRTNAEDFWDLRATRHLHPETRNYVPKFMAATIIAKNPAKYGFTTQYDPPLAYDEVVITRPTDLRVIAKVASVTYGELKHLNPELRRSVTPLGYDQYRLKLPVGTRAVFEQNFSKLPEWSKTVWMRHTVRRGETLASIARRFGTSSAVLRDMNQRSGDRIRVGATVLVPAGSQSPQYAGAPARPAVRPAASAPNTTYRVRRGDTLWHIAQKFDVPLGDLRVWNGLSRRDGIQAGQRLVLHPTSDQPARVKSVDLTDDSPPSKRPKRLTYRVKRGDTLWALSKNFNVPISDIRKWNGLSRTGTIRSGQRLVLYVNAEQS
ncbi:MAG TPA: LysM peptidoglycan-binding domain-containing protein [Nitrospiria bacterium]|nr:LysM peptidoglycan-binding domain-containing protein [Nitrospiria bacterium]